MTTAALVPVEEYLATVYEPDCDFVDGRLEERNAGEFNHGRMLGSLGLRFSAFEKRCGFRGVAVIRIQTGPRNRKPILCAEVLSPQDRHEQIVERLNEYLALGIRDVWMIDPEAREAYIARPDGLHLATKGVLRLTDYDVAVNLSELFEALD